MKRHAAPVYIWLLVPFCMISAPAVLFSIIKVTSVIVIHIYHCSKVIQNCKFPFDLKMPRIHRWFLQKQRRRIPGSQDPSDALFRALESSSEPWGKEEREVNTPLYISAVRPIIHCRSARAIRYLSWRRWSPSPHKRLCYHNTARTNAKT